MVVGPGHGGPEAEQPWSDSPRFAAVLAAVMVLCAVAALLLPSPQERRFVVLGLLLVSFLSATLLGMWFNDRRKARAAAQGSADPAGDPVDPGPPDDADPDVRS